jgi:5-methylcytosine-specific restriction endonuclease McrA
MLSFSALQRKGLVLRTKELGSYKWKRLRLQVLDRDGWVCAICGGVANTADHIYPRVKGGDMWALDNLQALCNKCNSSKQGRFFNRQPTPPVFFGRPLPETVQIVPDSPFDKPEGLQNNGN